MVVYDRGVVRARKDELTVLKLGVCVLIRVPKHRDVALLAAVSAEILRTPLGSRLAHIDMLEILVYESGRRLLLLGYRWFCSLLRRVKIHDVYCW
jgi:hypothetical protein